MLTDGGYLADPLTLAQRLMEKLQVDLTDDIDGGSSAEMYVTLFNSSNFSGKDRFLNPISISRAGLFLSIRCVMDANLSCPPASQPPWSPISNTASYRKNQV